MGTRLTRQAYVTYAAQFRHVPITKFEVPPELVFAASSVRGDKVNDTIESDRGDEPEEDPSEHTEA